VENDEAQPITEPFPMAYYIDGRSYVGGAVEDWIAPTTIALWAHCQSGMTTEQFLDWIKGELELLDGIDPYCEK
jgi:hypothetical protein